MLAWACRLPVAPTKAAPKAVGCPLPKQTITGTRERHFQLFALSSQKSP